jgi:hypothetical protein
MSSAHLDGSLSFSFHADTCLPLLHCLLPVTPASQYPTIPTPTFAHIRGLRPSFLDSIYAFPYRPAKKRCQFRVIYNIPVAPAVDATNADGTEVKPTMSANPTQCPSAALKIAGDCIHCSKVFCSAHRTPETHNW